MSAPFFRANVGACVIDPQGRILALKRKGVADNAWQMPQGGIEKGEDPRVAVWRELEEETGLLPQDVQIVAEYPEWLAYELPIEYRSSKVGWGQVQKWFVMRASREVLVRPDGKEFEAFAWFQPVELMPLVVTFRRATYERVFDLALRSR